MSPPRRCLTAHHEALAWLASDPADQHRDGRVTGVQVPAGQVRTRARNCAAARDDRGCSAFGLSPRTMGASRVGASPTPAYKKARSHGGLLRLVMLPDPHRTRTRIDVGANFAFAPAHGTLRDFQRHRKGAFAHFFVQGAAAEPTQTLDLTAGQKHISICRHWHHLLVVPGGCQNIRTLSS